MKIKLAVAALGVTAVALAGCGSTTLGGTSTTTTAASASTGTPATAPSGTSAPVTSPTAASSTTLSEAAYGQKYLSIVDPLNADVSSFITTLQNVPASDTGPQIQTLADPVVADISNGETQLLAVQWPGSAQTDIKALVASLGTVNDDLKSFGGLNTNDQASALVTKLNNDLAASSTEAKMIRTDLGLPQTS